MRIFAFCLVSLLMAGGATAQEGTVPQPVIDQCNATVEGYDDMPDCLKGGAVGYEMLRVAADADLYGEVAQEVADICSVRNETYYAQWICLRNAARKAVEIRRLMGEANMTDRCYRALSDPDALERIEQREAALRKAVRGDSHWSGGTMYASFEGCPEDAAGEAAEHAGAADGDHAPPFEDNGGYSPEGCVAYGEVDAFFRGTSGAELRAIYEALTPLPAGERLGAMTGYGLSQSTVELLGREMAGEERMGTGFLLLGLFRAAHPELYDELVAAQEPGGGEFSEAMASGMVDVILSGVVDGYRTFCEAP